MIHKEGDHQITCPNLAHTDAFATFLAQYLRPGDVGFVERGFGGGGKRP